MNIITGITPAKFADYIDNLDKKEKQAKEKSPFLYDGVYINAKELAERLQPLAKKMGIKIYSAGKAVYYDFGNFRQCYRAGHFGKHWTKVLDEKINSGEIKI